MRRRCRPARQRRPIRRRRGCSSRSRSPRPSLSVQSINFTSTPPAGAAVGGAAYTVAATASSGPCRHVLGRARRAPGSARSPAASCRSSAPGTCTIDANQAGDAQLPGGAAGAAVLRGRARRRRRSASRRRRPSAAIVGDPAYTVTATATSGLAGDVHGRGRQRRHLHGAPARRSRSSARAPARSTRTSPGTARTRRRRRCSSRSPSRRPSASSQTISFTSTAPGRRDRRRRDLRRDARRASSGPRRRRSRATAGERGRVHRLGLDGLVRRHRHLHDQREPGRQRELSGGAAGAAVVRGRPDVADDQLHLDAARRRDRRRPRPTPSRRRPPPACPVTFTRGREQRRHLHGLRLHGLVRRRRHLHRSTPTRPATPRTRRRRRRSSRSRSAARRLRASSRSPSPLRRRPARPSAAPTYTVAATASSGLAVVFSVDASSAGVCTVAGSTVSLHRCGHLHDRREPGRQRRATCAAPQVQQSFAVGLAPQTISFTSSPPGGADVGGPAYTVSATAIVRPRGDLHDRRGQRGRLHDQRLDGVVHRRGHVHDQREPGRQRHVPGRAAGAAVRSTVTSPPPPASTQSITFTSTPPAAAAVGGPATRSRRRRAPACRSPSRSTPASAGVCTISGSTVSFVGTGTCTIDANQAGNASYQAAPQAQQSFAVGLASQTISFTSSPPGGATVGGPTYTVSATASSGLAVTFSIAPGERRCLHPLGLGRLVHRRGHLHDPREPGRQRQLPGGAAGAAVVRRRQSRAVAERADDHVHLDAAGRSRRRRAVVHRDGDRELRPRRHLHASPRRARASAT